MGEGVRAFSGFQPHENAAGPPSSRRARGLRRARPYIALLAVNLDVRHLVPLGDDDQLGLPFLHELALQHLRDLDLLLLALDLAFDLQVGRDLVLLLLVVDLQGQLAVGELDEHALHLVGEDRPDGDDEGDQRRSELPDHGSQLLVGCPVPAGGPAAAPCHGTGPGGSDDQATVRAAVGRRDLLLQSTPVRAGYPLRTYFSGRNNRAIVLDVVRLLAVRATGPAKSRLGPPPRTRRPNRRGRAVNMLTPNPACSPRHPVARNAAYPAIRSHTRRPRSPPRNGPPGRPGTWPRRCRRRSRPGPPAAGDSTPPARPGGRRRRRSKCRPRPAAREREPQRAGAAANSGRTPRSTATPGPTVSRGPPRLALRSHPPSSRGVRPRVNRKRGGRSTKTSGPAGVAGGPARTDRSEVAYFLPRLTFTSVTLSPSTVRVTSAPSFAFRAGRTPGLPSRPRSCPCT